MPSCSLFLKFRCCILSHIIEVDPFIFRCVFLYEIQNCIFHVFSLHGVVGVEIGLWQL